MCHPKVLDEMLTDEDYYDWFRYYKQKPFGHWIDNEMRARAIEAWSGKFEMPSIVENVELSEEEQIAILPGMSEAESFLRRLNSGKRDHDNDRDKMQERLD